MSVQTNYPPAQYDDSLQFQPELESSGAFRVDAGRSGALTVLERGDHIRPSRFIMSLPVGYGPPVAQLHPTQTEQIRILRGVVDITVDGVERRFGPGDTLFIPAGSWHSSKNPGTQPVDKLVVMTPGMGVDEMLGRMYTAKQGTHGLYQKLSMINVLIEYPANVLFRPPVHAMFRLIVGVGRRIGLLGPAPEIAGSIVPHGSDLIPSESSVLKP